jgi:hypothetical protein
MVGLLLAALLCMPGTTPAECDPGCERESAAELINRGDTRAAIQALKDARGRFPDDRGLALLLARAYLLEDNLFWAERTLLDAIERRPDDAELRAWLAVVHLRQGDPELLAADLRPELEPAEDPGRARWLLLAASRARLDGDDAGAAETLGGLDRRRTLFPEDRKVWASLNADADPWWSESITGTLELGLGATSNALAGSPTDPGREGESSGLGLVELRARVVPPGRSKIRPAAEIEIIGDGIGNPDYRDLSTLQGALRVGAVVTGGGRRLALGYRAEVLYLDQDPSLFSEAHRAELEIEWAGGAVAFGGFGHREYRDDKRTRWEGDLGLGGPLGRLGKASLVGGTTLRLADAESPAYDQLGLSAALSARLPVAARSALWIDCSAVWDDYFNSGGPEGRLVFGTDEKRRDLLGRAALTLWAPPWGRLRPGVELRYTDRASTADTAPGFNFGFREWRAVAWLRFSFAADPWGPRTDAGPDHVPLEWGLADDAAMDEERILDLLRRDEELRRGSSCGLR